MGRAKRTAGWGGGGYSANAVKGWLGKLNQGHRSLIVAESVDASTDRIVRYLAEIGVPINVATVQHFEDANGRELLAQVYLIEPEAVQPRARRTSAKSGYRTVNELQALADGKGIGGIYRRLRDGVRGIFFAQGYSETVAYVHRLELTVNGPGQ